jgi:amino acid transporter
MPLTGVVLLGIVLVVLSYREVVTVYTRAGGSYVVARENFGPRVAQIAAVALMVDYVVTVAVQNSAGSAAILSTFPALGRPLGDTATLLLITVAATLLMCYVNLLGVRENGRTFALPTYLFSASVGLMIIVGLARELFGGGLGKVTWHSGTVPIGHGTSGLITFAAILVLARAFANGGSSLTGIEAVSNAVSALRPPEGRNARQILVTQGSIVFFLIAGISWIAHISHAVPYVSGVPTVVSQEASLVFGNSVIGQVMFYLVQAGAITILFTGGNTSFSGFPFLTSFVAEDSFLPRWLSKRGHRLVFSNGIIVLTVLALALLFAVGANTNNLVPFYAIGVFTGFSMAGFGMVRYHLRQREPGWRRRLVVNLTGGIYTALVVIIFAIVKFNEGAWLVVIVFPIGVFAFIRLNRQYHGEARALEGIGERRAAGEVPRQPNYSRRVVIVFVDDFDLSTIAALRYARSLRPTVVRAVHFVIDSEQAERLRAAWLPDKSVSLEFIDCPDRRLTRCAADLVAHEAKAPGTQVTAILPRRSFSPLVGRLLHDRTADKIAAVVSRVPNAAATIIPFDVQNRLHVLQQRQAERDGTAPASLTTPPGPPADGEPAEYQATWPPPRPTVAAAEQPEPLPGAGSYDRPIPPPGVTPIGSIHQPGKVAVEGRVRVVEIRSVEQNSVLACEISDSTGDLTALFYGRSRIAGLMCGSRVRFKGPVGLKHGAPVMVNPAYELIVPPTTSKPSRDGE